jgi:hypothetical protein
MLSTPNRWPWILAGVMALSCVTPRAASPELLVARASFDFGCPRESLTIHAFDARTRAVVGCGQRATYVEDCRAPGRACTWIADVGPIALPAAPVPVASAPTPAATTAAPVATAQWPALSQSPALPAATATVQPQPLPGDHAFRNEEDYGF